MIKELADYENLADQVAITEDDLRRTLFGPDAIVYDTVVEAIEKGALDEAIQEAMKRRER